MLSLPKGLTLIQRIPVIFRLALAAICFVAFAHAGRGSPEPAGVYTGVEPTGPTGEVITLSSLGKSAIGLLVAQVKKQPLPLEVQTTGKVEAIPLKEFVQHAPLSGRITDVKVELGDNVQSGQILVTVDSPEINQLAAETLQNKADLESEVSKVSAQMDSEIEQDRVQVSLWEADYKRAKKLFDEGIVAQKAMLESQAQLKLAESKLTAVIQKREISVRSLKRRQKVTLDALYHRLSQLGVSPEDVAEAVKKEQTILQVPVRSARAGVITDITAFAGEGIDPKVPLFKISDLSEVWVTADVYEDDMARMKVGEPVVAKIAAIPNEAFKGRLAYIGRQVSSETRTLPVRAEIDNRLIKLKPGMFASVQIQTAEPIPAILVPREAVVERNGHHIVFIETRGGYQACRVKVGRSFGDEVEVSEGLVPGSSIVVRGAFQLDAELLKSHGGADMFLQATQGQRETIEQEENAAPAANRPNYQPIFISLIVAFVLGFAASFLLQRSERHAKAKEGTRLSSVSDSERIARG